ncbi:DEAD/DEAH box helicase family protein [Bacillus cereus]|uniref:DEAD/DEAH box helicase n=1 Tax=Bacillus cereus TaxID=1396 RepID=UPI002AC2CC70|nr:DEAD/DEAH box helicase family protein [Bacillus cereus]MDZ4654052.1 DEAD/DEAH box helicase family protein [Bacillus cereus]
MTKATWEKRSVLSPHLRDYQIKAIDKAIDYIKSDCLDQALIKMATGTGKTIIIGVLACFIRGVNNILIVSPSEAIRDQLFKEIKADLWKKLGLEVDIEKSITKLFPRNARNLVDKQEKKVFVTTIQALTKMKNEKKEEYVYAYGQLKEQIDLILFDEGHKEPAPTWSQTIRDFKQKTILFSATPVRNDHQLFNISKDYFYNYSLYQATEEERVREIEFKIINQYGATREAKIEGFINKIIELREQYIIENNFEPKVIIRFANFDDIKLAHYFLKTNEENVIAIHERFKETKEDSTLYQNVPQNGNEAIYWLHQNKLVEGIDNSEFAILGIYQAFDNERSLIQQIGRIIRTDEKNSSKKGWVIVHSVDKAQKNKWENFYEIEKNDSSMNELPIANFKKLLDDLLIIQPEYIYEAKRFLRKFDYNISYNFEDAFQKYKLPLKTNILSYDGEDDEESIFKTILENIYQEKQLTNEVIVHSHISSDQRMALLVYSKYSNSPILHDESFIEVKLGLCFFWIFNNCIFFYDTNNKVSSTILEISKPLNYSALHELFDQDSEFTALTLRNGVISRNNIHRQVINSRNMKEIAPNITDKYNFCTNVTGKIVEGGKKRSRYVGFSNSRVSDNSTYVLFEDYLKWIKNISETINEEQNYQKEFFDRFAPIIDKPENPTPIRILLDLTEFEDHIVNSNGEKVEIENIFYKVKNDQFNLIIDDQLVTILVEYKENKYNLKFADSIYNKYKFDTEITTEDYTIKENMSLLQFLNRYQHFQIITQDIKHVYYKKTFYKCEILSEDTRLTKVFDEYSLIHDKKIDSEKGDLKTVRTEWSEDSLFYLVSSLGKDIDESNGESYLKKNLEKMDYLICTDLEKEIADFIGVNLSENQVYFIHCKAKKAKYAASVFQDVCGQIMKNLDYVHPLSKREPKDLAKWNQDWTNQKVTRSRIIKGDISAEVIWEKIKEIQRDSESVTNVWALTGDMFSLDTYLKQKEEGVKQHPEIIQFDYLLMNTWTAVQSVGAKFKVIFDKKA